MSRMTPDVLASLRAQHRKLYVLEARGFEMAFRQPPESFYYDVLDLVMGSKLERGTKPLGISQAYANLATAGVVYPDHATANGIFADNMGLAASFGVLLFSALSSKAEEDEKKDDSSGDKHE